MLQFEELENHVQQFARKYDLMYNPTTMECYGKYGYMRVDRIPKYSGDQAYYIIHAVCGIRTMGEFEPKDMIAAQEEIGHVAQKTSWFNVNFRDVKILVDMTTDTPIRNREFESIILNILRER